MAKLSDILLDSSKRSSVVQDCVSLIDEEVRSKSGFSGIAVKGAYAIVKKIKPSIVMEVVERLVEPFSENLDPFYQTFLQGGAKEAFTTFLLPKAPAVANALLAITDERAKKSDNRTLRGAYDKLRPTGVKHVESAVPAIGKLIQKYV